MIKIKYKKCINGGEKMETILICLVIGGGIMVLLYMLSLTDDDKTDNTISDTEAFIREHESMLPHGRCQGLYNLTCLNKWDASVEIILYKDILEINEIKFPWDKITNAVIKTETQIQKDISAGKILAFGIFALASKKTRTVTENYLVITYLNEFDNEEDLIFSHQNSKDDYPTNVIENIKKVYSEYKQNQSNNQENKEALQ